MLDRNSYLVPRVVALYYLAADQVDYVFRIVNGRTERLVQLKAAASWQPLHFTVASADWEDKGSKDAAGRIKRQEVSLFYPGDGGDKDSELRNIELGRHLVRLVYDNGDDFVLGSPATPLSCQVAFDSKRKGSTLTFARNIAL
jgi:hypothetical protein